MATLIALLQQACENDQLRNRRQDLRSPLQGFWLKWNCRFSNGFGSQWYQDLLALLDW